MGPKKQKGKKGKKKKDKKKVEPPPKPKKSEYLAKIAASNAILAQARRKIKSIEDEYFGAEKRYKELQEDTQDIFDYLKFKIEENEEEIALFNEKILKYKEELAKIDEQYANIFDKMEKEFEEKKHKFEQQIQILRAKIFASEEIRKRREEFLEKKRNFIKRLEEMQSRHEREIYEAEKLAIMRQDTMQKEMQRRLTTLATDFRQAIDIAIGETMNKLIRDNVHLGNTLTCMQEILEKARSSYLKTHAAELKYKYKTELIDDERGILSQKYLYGVDLIENLMKTNEDLNERIAMNQKLIQTNRRLLREIAEMDCIAKERAEDLNKLSVVLTEREEVFEAAGKEFKEFKKVFIQLEYLIFDVAKRVKEGVEIESMTKLEERELTELEKEEQEDMLMEHKFKARETAAEQAIEKLMTWKQGIPSDMELLITAPSSATYVSSDSTISNFLRGK